MSETHRDSFTRRGENYRVNNQLKEKGFLAISQAHRWKSSEKTLIFGMGHISCSMFLCWGRGDSGGRAGKQRLLHLTFSNMNIFLHITDAPMCSRHGTAPHLTHWLSSVAIVWAAFWFAQLNTWRGRNMRR